MAFWVLQDHDTLAWEAEAYCRLEMIEPFNVKPSDSRCPRCGSLLEPAHWAPPHKAKISSSNCGDLILGVSLELVISSRAWNALNADMITGLALVAPLETVPRSPELYVVTRPKVTVTRLDELRSNYVWRRAPTCDLCRLGVRRSVGPVIIEESTWDGTDIFVPSGLYGLKLVTTRFVDCIERHGLKHFRFVPAEDYREIA